MRIFSDENFWTAVLFFMKSVEVLKARVKKLGTFRSNKIIYSTFNGGIPTNLRISLYRFKRICSIRKIIYQLYVSIK